MYVEFANGFVYALFAYVSLGFVFALAFVSVGVQNVDPEARGTKLGFRLLIIPGVIAFWPIFLKRWANGMTTPPFERNPHR